MKGSLTSALVRPFRQIIGENRQTPLKDSPSLSLYIGCAADSFCPQISSNAKKVLNHLGYTVNIPAAKLCCGAPAKYMGNLDEARDMAKECITALEATGEEPVVTLCPACVSALSYDYEALFAGDQEWINRARKLAQRVIEFTHFISILPEVQKRQIGINCIRNSIFSGTNHKTVKVTYHDSCHLKQNLGISKEPRELLKHSRGLEYVEMHNSDCCCGYGGSCSVKFPELSGPAVEKKLSAIEDAHAEILAVACPGCLIQLNRELAVRGSQVKVKHVAELFAASV